VGSGFVPHRQIFFQKKALHMTTSALIASKTPFAAEVEAGKDYYWCSCGRSQSQPFCDGKHQGTTPMPTKYTAPESKTVYFCGCKQSAAGQFCDGAHQKLG
jgi:CDGSH iron-sulfur domain-containing protein 3